MGNDNLKPSSAIEEITDGNTSKLYQNLKKIPPMSNLSTTPPKANPSVIPHKFPKKKQFILKI
jgi:hypothetical protein